MARTADGHGHGYGFTEPELREGWQDNAFAKRAHRMRAGCRWPVHGPRACALPGSRTAASGLADHPPQAAGRTAARGPLPLRLSVSHWVGGPGRTPDHTKPITWRAPRSDTITRHITARTPPANPVDLNIHRFLKVWTGSCRSRADRRGDRPGWRGALPARSGKRLSPGRVSRRCRDRPRQSGAWPDPRRRRWPPQRLLPSISIHNGCRYVARPEVCARPLDRYSGAAEADLCAR